MTKLRSRYHEQSESLLAVLLSIVSVREMSFGIIQGRLELLAPYLLSCLVLSSMDKIH